MKSKRQVLIVEDNMLNREMLAEILSERYTVLQAENGLEALEILKNNNVISLILLDIMMPVMDGYALLDRIKADRELSLIPVIIMTQTGNEANEVEALAHGATDFIPKPYRPQVILHRVASLINLRETAAIINQYQYDRLTGLYSKDFFYHKVQEQLLDNPEKEYSIVCSNIENFKLFNDIFGSQEGDRLLREVANTARSMIGSTGFCGRLDADHFLCFQERSKEQQDRSNFGNYEHPQPSPLMKNIVMRWGIYEIIDRSIPVEQMCDRALLAANSIKGQYNKFFAVYDDALRGKLLREKAITDAMGFALSDNQFVVYLQPKYSLRDKCIIGAEALVRWNHPEWGLVSPGEFIPLFEKNGFISRLDRYVWEQVCILLSDWKSKGQPLIPISVNVSRAEMYKADLLETLSGLIEKYGIEPALLHLEITESAYAENSVQILNAAKELSDNGFIIEMDDFGSGYSSLNMLSRMTLDVLKLDMKFIQNEIDKPTDHRIISDIVTMAHKMRLHVIAEGVETREQMKYLQNAGCDYAQGYFFAKPMPAADFDELWMNEAHKTVHTADHILHNRSILPVLLAVDEDEEYRRKVADAFDGQYRVVQACDAKNALKCIEACEDSEISAVLISMTLPDGGSAYLIDKMRRESTFWYIPVIATIPGGDRSDELPLAQEADDFMCKCHPMFDLRKRLQMLVDISEAHKRERLLQDEACRDYLTKLLNRRGFQSAVTSLRKDDLPIAVCLFDLDNLKHVNDTSGHIAGDRIIRTFADLLRRNTESDDIICRYGGDEFIAILKHLDDPGNAKIKCSDICRSFRESFPQEKFTASCSVGIALCKNGKKPSEDLIERADRALYRAKRDNKGGFSVWSEDAD